MCLWKEKKGYISPTQAKKGFSLFFFKPGDFKSLIYGFWPLLFHWLDFFIISIAPLKDYGRPFIVDIKVASSKRTK
jgi:hypothetical protein